MLEAQRCWYCCKQDIADGIQSVGNQVGQEVEPVEYFLLADFSKLGDVLTFIFVSQWSCLHFYVLVKPLYGILEMTLILITILCGHTNLLC